MLNIIEILHGSNQNHVNSRKSPSLRSTVREFVYKNGVNPVL